MTTKQRATISILPLTLLATIGLIVAKMGFGVNVAWLWVFAPMWLPFVIVLAITIAGLVIAGVVTGVAFIGSVLVSAIANALDKNSRKPT